MSTILSFHNFPTTRIGATFKWANSDAVSSSTTQLSLTPNFILPVEKRPNLAEVAKSGYKVPIIDLGGGSKARPEKDELQLVKEIVRASEEYGLFLVVNHGIEENLCQSMLGAVTDLFHLPPEEKALLVSDDLSKDVRICNHYRKVEGGDEKKAKRSSMWSEVFKHPWHPSLDDYTALLPSDPPSYRETVKTYAKEVAILMSYLLSLMSRGLGLDRHYLMARLGTDPFCRAQANYYPPCPDPNLTLGLGVHTDRDVLTVVLPTPGVAGLQIMKDDKWVAVDPFPNALIVNIGDQLQVLSNGKYKSVLHRVVTNESQSRVSLAMFYGPDRDAFIGPIEDLINEQHPPIYRSYYFREFLDEYRKQEGKNRVIKESFEISLQ